MNNTTAVVEQVVNSKLKVKTTKNIISSGFTILVYGESGTGKTFDIQFVKNPFVISAEGGLLTLNSTDIPFIEVDNWLDFMEALKFVFNDESMKDKTICIDSLSVLSEYCYDHYYKLNNGNQLKAYQLLGEQFPKIIDALQKKNRNVYLIAQMDKDVDADTGAISKYRPLIKGKVSSIKIPYIVDFIFAKKIVLNKDNKLQRCIFAGLDNKHEIKSRIKLSKDYYKDISEIFAELEQTTNQHKE